MGKFSLCCNAINILVRLLDHVDEDNDVIDICNARVLNNQSISNIFYCFIVLEYSLLCIVHINYDIRHKSSGLLIITKTCRYTIQIVLLLLQK